jgi:hypothetical protein
MKPVHAHTFLFKPVLACALSLLFLAHAPDLPGADDKLAGESAEPVKRLIKRISSTRESLMLSAVCDPDTLSLGKGMTGCKVCPSYTGSPGETGGFTVESIITGTFTRTNSSEAILNMTGCGSRHNAPGAIVLLRQQEKGWTRVWYQPGRRLEDCISFRTGRGIQSLLCNRGETVQGVESGELVWVSLDENNVNIDPLIAWYDNIQTNPRDLVSIYPYRMFRSDFNQDGHADVRVMFNVIEHRIPQEYSGALDAVQRSYQLPELEKLGVIYIFDGNELSPHPKSEPNLEKIRSLLDAYMK